MEQQLAKIGWMAAGFLSKTACQVVDPVIVGVTPLVDVAEALSGDAASIDSWIKEVDLLFIVVSLDSKAEATRAIQMADFAKQRGRTIVFVALTSADELDAPESPANNNQAALMQSGFPLLKVSNKPSVRSQPDDQDNPCGDTLAVAAVRAVADLINRAGLMGVEFMDVRAALTRTGLARLGLGDAEGDDRAKVAVDRAVKQCFLDRVPFADAVLINISTGLDAEIHELDDVVGAVRAVCPDTTLLVAGMPLSREMGSRMRVTLIATGLPA